MSKWSVGLFKESLMYIQFYSADVSTQFYTHYQRYKMALGIITSRHNNGAITQMSVGLYLTKGPYDGYLAWPM